MTPLESWYPAELEQLKGRLNHLLGVVDHGVNVLDHDDRGPERDPDRRSGEIELVSLVSSARPVVEVGVSLARRAGQNHVDPADQVGELGRDHLRRVPESAVRTLSSRPVVDERRNRRCAHRASLVVAPVDGHGVLVLVNCRNGPHLVAELAAGLFESERQPTWTAEELDHIDVAPGRIDLWNQAMEVGPPPLTPQIVNCRSGDGHGRTVPFVTDFDLMLEPAVVDDEPMAQGR